jgi:hypothetical protein
VGSESYDAEFKLKVIDCAKKMNNCNAARKFSVTDADKVEEMTAEADKCELHPEIFHWCQGWTFQRIRTGNFSVSALEEKNWSASCM